MSVDASLNVTNLPTKSKPAIESGVIGMIIFVVCEIMMFAGFISAFFVTKASARGGVWPPPGQPRLPIEETLINTFALLLSGVVLYYSQKNFSIDKAKSKKQLMIAILLGSFFLIFQGFEWAALIKEGLTLTSSNHGAFFYLIIGFHALHVVLAVFLLLYTFLQFQKEKLKESSYITAQVFWYFVVGIWPVLYGIVYF